MIEDSNFRDNAGVGGFTMVGMIVGFLVLGLLLSPLLNTLLTAQRGFVASRERAQAAGSVRYAHLSLTRYLRLAGSNPYRIPIQGLDPDPSGDGKFDDVRVRADYNPADGDTDDPGEDLTFFVRGDTMLVRAGPAGPQEPYLIGVDSLAFEYFDRDGVLLTDPARVMQRAASARVVIHGRGSSEGTRAMRTLAGHVRLRNGG